MKENAEPEIMYSNKIAKMTEMKVVQHFQCPLVWKEKRAAYTSKGREAAVDQEQLGQKILLKLMNDTMCIKGLGGQNKRSCMVKTVNQTDETKHTISQTQLRRNVLIHEKGSGKG